MVFDGGGSCSFCNDFARNVFGVNNTSSSHTNYRKISILVLDKNQPMVLIIALVQDKPKQSKDKFLLNLTLQWWQSYLYVNKTEI